ncbi:metallophosphatase family protein [Paucibacter sp. B2R-40]|uniref:metallophosphoesterase family protein n=1 Tax=Paucibacter sp. B2R-40 TaxID=2893554 RepID=UPI0021E4DF3E|nr:metallophosphatase family protein [Paucibacter sp. B2R-40]MCV2355795.1 metallophosphatase family protein [Paucibacter sp. B2R-40]
MKIALITDIHANAQAFSAVLEHAQTQGVTDYALLGDFVGYGGDPGWVLDKVRELVSQGAVAVLGNHDAAVAKGEAPTMRDEAQAAVIWTHARLTAEQLVFLAQLPLSVTVEDRLFVHANAFDPGGWAYVQGRLEAMRSLHATSSRFTFCGHMHEPMLYHLSGTGKAGEFTPTAGVTIPLLPNRQWLVIPGSCGQPRDGNPAACYAIFDSLSGDLNFQRVPYDVEGAAASIRAAGLPERLAERLLTGQ